MGRPKGTDLRSPTASQPAAAPVDPLARSSELNKLANAAIGQFKMEQALEHLDQALALAPLQASLWSNRAFVFESLKQPARALSDAQECLRLEPGMPKGQLRAARALLSLGRAEEARALLEGTQSLQDPSLRHALQEALEHCSGSQGQQCAAGAAGPSEAECGQSLPAAAAADACAADGELPGSSPYYYWAHPVDTHLPPKPPQRILAPAAGTAAPQTPIAAGAIQRDIEKRGSDSYYYAHARTTTVFVPPVPHKISADGSHTPWEPSGKIAHAGT
tara:strand:+ start:113 stop:940 length:828 start_codon:yes stop_codon:yes gene_type:complete